MELRIEGKMLNNPQKAALTRGMQGKGRTEMYVLSVQSVLNQCYVAELMHFTYGFSVRDYRYIRFL